MRLTDPRAMRAMAHPLRLDLIELLGVLGPATAAACGRQLGASQASCSFHLRQLAKYGFVELAPASGDRRERPWRLTDVEQSWSSVDAGPAAAQLDRVFVQREADRMLGWLTTGPTEPEEWRRAAWVGGLTLPVTAAELDSIGESLRAVLEPYVQRLAGQPWPADARLVRILLSATPLTRDLSPDPAPDLPATAPDLSPYLLSARLISCRKEAMTTTEWTAVPTALGDLRALIHVPDAPGPHPGVVLVDGSGDGACDDWGEWPDRLVGRGAVVLAHDKPGCGGSPGHWTSQSLTDRAHETLAAVRVLRAHSAVAGRPVGLFGMSQGGWVSLLAASLRTEPVDFIVSVSGPGVGPAAQDRVRLERELRALDTPPLALAEALDWIDERNRRLIAGEPPLDVLAAQQGYADRSWYGPVSQYFDSPVMFTFLAGLMSFDPVEVMPRVLCPVLALFGGSDTLVPVPASVTAFATHLPRLPGDPHGIAVFPGADHGLFTADPDPAVPRTDQLAVGFLPMVGDFLHRGVNARNSG